MIVDRLPARVLAGLLVLVVAASTLLASPVPNARAAGETGSVTGTVIMPAGLTVPTGSIQLRAIKVEYRNSIITGIVNTPVAANGTFTLSGLEPGVEHRILFSAGSSYGSLLRTYHDGAFTYETTVPLVLEPGETRALGDVPLFRPGSITGSMSGTDGPVLSGGVQIMSGPVGFSQARPSGVGAASIFNSTNQTYGIGGLPPGDYVVRFSEAGYTWKTVYNGSSLTLEGAVPITVGLSEQVTLDVSLPPTPRIIGELTVSRHPSIETPIFSVLRAVPFPGTTAGTPREVYVDALGEYRVTGLTPGTYQVCIFDLQAGTGQQAIFEHCHGEDEANPQGRPVVVSDGTVTDIDLAVQGAARLSVPEVELANPPASDPFASIGFGTAVFWHFDEQLGYWVNVDEDMSIGGGINFLSAPLPAGDYRVQIQYAFGDVNYREYWPGGITRFADAPIITLLEGEGRALDGAIVDPTPLAVDRVSGPDRFSGSAAISREVVPTPPVSVVYIANGLVYPDALSAGPAVSAEGGTMLLVEPQRIPPAIETELRRLNPERIVIVGGTGSVSAAVESRLRTFVDLPTDVERHDGADRYATSRRVVSEAFEGRTGMTVVIATGRNYPDALAAGPVAAALGGPVLLVDGSRASLDPATRALLDALQPSAFLIAGGTGSVSAGIEAELGRRTNQVFRAPGRDRYETAGILNSIFIPEGGFAWDNPGGADLVYVATGTGFADALAGGPLAARNGAPLYLTPPNCLPPGILDAVDDLGARELVILGGTGSVSAAVEAGATCGFSASRGETTELQRAFADLLP